MDCKCGESLHPNDGAYCIDCMFKAGGLRALTDEEKVRWLKGTLKTIKAHAQEDDHEWYVCDEDGNEFLVENFIESALK